MKLQSLQQWNLLFVRTVCLLMAFLAMPSFAQAEKTSAEEFRIAGYLPYYRFSRFTEEQAAQLTDLIVFSAEVDADGKLDMSPLRDAPWKMFAKLQKEHQLRVHLCLVNAHRTKGFSLMTASSTKRKAFINDLLKVCETHSLNGIDLDWEFPRGEAEQDAYAKLMVELQQELKPRKMTLSVAMASRQKLPVKAYDAVDWIHIMAYDHAVRHSTMNHADQDVQSFLDRKIDPSKLVLGIPFYGRRLDNWSKASPYSQIIQVHGPSEEMDEAGGYYFNNRETVLAKTRYAIGNRLGGVMVWELGQDAQGEQSLLSWIHSGVREEQAFGQ